MTFCALLGLNTSKSLIVVGYSVYVWADFLGQIMFQMDGSIMRLFLYELREVCSEFHSVVAGIISSLMLTAWTVNRNGI